MCNRHVAHLIAEYEAARLAEGERESGDVEGDDVESAPADTGDTSAERSNLLTAVRSLFTR